MYANLFDDPELINRMLGRYLSVTPERIRSAAAEVFRDDNRVVMTYVPAPRRPTRSRVRSTPSTRPARMASRLTRRPLHDR